MFSQNGYTVLKNLVSGPTGRFLYEYAVKSARRGKLSTEDPMFPTTPCVYGDALMDSLMEELLPHVERATGCKLFPTYSYLRVYQRGDVLTRHTDRPACEISVSLNLGYKPSKPWPLWLEARGKALNVLLEPGDGLIYKGIDLPHWRKPFRGEHAAQVFLHYVNRKGPQREWVYDKRPGSSASPSFRKLIRKLNSGDRLRIPVST